MSKRYEIVPLRDQVLLQRFRDDMTEGGLHIPETANSTSPIDAVVLAVGPGKIEHGKLIEPRVKPGDHVALIPECFGARILANGEEFMLLKEQEICAVIDTHDSDEVH